jgi:hypothetical protein
MFLDRLNYKEALYKNMINRRGALNLPKDFDPSVLASIDKNLSIKEQLLAIEEEMFGGRYKFFGDKGIFSPGAKVLNDFGLDFKLIIIHRDPRDVVRSVKRHYPGSHFGYKTNDTTKIGDIWADWFLDMKFAGKNYASDCLVIRFEDYIDNPGLNGEKINSFLGITGMEMCEKQTINIHNTHKGYYKNINLDWQKNFSEKTKQLMKRFNYI